jgi:hypothetical protein
VAACAQGQGSTRTPENGATAAPPWEKSRPKKAAGSGGVECAACQAKGTLGSLSRCEKCRAVFYCNRACQRKHWTEGGHKKVCRRHGTAQPSHVADPDPGPENPCPICLVHEDNYG